MRRFLVHLLALLALCASLRAARAEEGADLEANSAILAHLQEELPKLGLGKLHIGGGAALALAMAARNGTTPTWHDIDVRAFPRGRMTEARMARIAAALTRDGFAELLPPGTIEFLIHRRGQGERLFRQGFGLRMQTKAGLRFDVAVLLNQDELRRSGFNSAESLVIPLDGAHDLTKIVKRLGTGTAQQVVERGDLVEVHGHAGDVLDGKIVLTQRHRIALEPELSALRFLRGIEKLQNLSGRPVDAEKDLRWLTRNLRGMIRKAPGIKDPGYGPQVQEQAKALLKSGGPQLLAAARRMGLDLNALAAGRIPRAKR